MKTYFCWRCNTDMPFLDEDEWLEISPLLTNDVTEIKEYRKEHGCDITTARLNCKQNATKKFEELTGMPDIHFEVIYHHRLIDCGAECKKCGHLLRTPEASYCANCGYKTK